LRLADEDERLLSLIRNADQRGWQGQFRLFTAIKRAIAWFRARAKNRANTLKSPPLCWRVGQPHPILT
jgi:hypothetical protein